VLFPSSPTAARLAAVAVVAVALLGADTPSAAVSAAALASARAAKGTASVWVWPIDEPRVLVRPYVAPATPYSAGHRGIDIGAQHPGDGQPVYAPSAGVVHFAGVVVDRPVLSIRHSDGLISSFEPVSSELVAGDAVLRGQQVGLLQPGHCATPCLHFGVRHDGEYVSPLNFLGGIPHSVLLPTRKLARPPDRAADVVAEGRHQQ